MAVRTPRASAARASHAAAGGPRVRAEAPPEHFLWHIDVPWRDPVQQRSRERVARIMAVARELIAEGGIANLKVDAIATGAEIPIGTLYQFFPDKSAVIGRILFDEMEVGLRELWEHCNPPVPLSDPTGEITGLMRSLFDRRAKDPVMSEIWSIVQADRTLSQISVESSNIQATIMCDAFEPLLRDGVRPKRLRMVCFMLGDLWDAATRTALEFPPEEAQLLMDEFISAAGEHLDSLLKPV